MTNQIWAATREREAALVEFLRDIVRIPSPSGQERAVVERIAAQMSDLHYDDVRIDPLGNVVGRVGRGPRIIAFDGHVDTVLPTDGGRPWSHDPHGAQIENGNLYGCGAVDQKAGVAAQVFAGGLLKQLGIADDVTLYVVGSVQEEDCDGLCWQYILRETSIRPDCVVLSEPTNLALHLGHRGRVDIAVTVRGKAAHASAPSRGENAVYAMGRILAAIEKLNDELPVDDVLGRGTVAVTDVRCSAPSLCSIPDGCTIHLDRRITRRDSRASVLAEVRRAVDRAGEQAEVAVPLYDLPSYRGLRYPSERYFPAWLLSENDPSVVAGREAFREIFAAEPRLAHWVFSTNGVATMGLFDIPTIGFGPGEERWAHAVDERVPIADVVQAAAWYAAFPQAFSRAARVTAPAASPRGRRRTNARASR